MNLKYTKKLIFLAIFNLLALATAAQTITIGNVDAGPYGQGSTITAPIAVNTGTGCLSTNNVYDLYLSDANGNFNVQKKIGSISGFYATFVNGVIPTGLPNGSGYRLRVISTNPVVTSNTSAAFTISGPTGVVAAVSSQIINPQYPEVFGSCLGKDNSNYTFLNQSTTGSTVTASFYNDLSQAMEGSNVPLLPSVGFNAKAANYTVTIKAVNGGIVGTKSYLLINNVVNTSFGITGSPVVCLANGGDLSFNVDITSVNGIQKNYPGLTYSVKWGDGATSLFTICDIIAQGGKIAHIYAVSSCGNNVNGKKNVFEVDLQPLSVYCDNSAGTVTTYAKIIAPPLNKFTEVPAACVNTPVTFANTSYPGQDATSNSGSCININARYSWYVDGELKAQNYGATQPFVYTFPTTGQHAVRLLLQNSAGSCGAADITQNICIQEPPKPAFTLPATAGCAPLSITPNNTSIIDANCNTSNSFAWQVTGPSPVTYANNTDATSPAPNFVFNKAGVYKIKLVINTVSCGPVESPEQTITVDETPVAQLSADASVCGINQTFRFNTQPGITRTTVGGIGDLKPDSYTWTISGGAFEFTGGTTANTRYPQILFKDAAVYTVTVVTKNSCGTPATDTQQLTFQLSPTITASADNPTICAGTSASLKGVVTSGTISSQEWSGGTGSFSDVNALNTSYTPSAAEVAAGTVTLVLTGNTSLPAPCDKIVSTVTVTIEPQNSITSQPVINNLCSGTAVNYNITASKPNSIFTWTVNQNKTSASVTGYALSGSGTLIKDVLTNSDAQNSAKVTYIIQATGGNCNGNSFELTVNVAPKQISVSFTTDKTEGCGPVSVQFTNTSIPLTSNFLWDFGDGTTSADISPLHTFAPGTDGKDKVYAVTLQLLNTCGNKQTTPISITVRPEKPVALITAQQLSGCAPFKITVDNKSPGNNKSYTYYLYDGANLVESFILLDKSQAVFKPLSPTSTKLYKVYMVAEGLCGNTQKSLELPVTVSPPTFEADMFITDNQNKGCYPFTTSFVNNSTGGEKFVYNIYDKDGNAIDHKDAGIPGTSLSYTFTRAGIFYVSISAANNCSQIESDKTRNMVEVYPLPIPDFSADATTGCKDLLVTFNNLTQAPDENSQASAYSYDWDFGDGSPHSLVQNPAAHFYKYNNSPYTVTLVVTNLTTQCSATIAKNDFIKVNAPPFAAFRVKPDTVTSIPNYRFSFIDQTTGGATSWKWDLGDGQTSNSQNPEHTYRDTGIYKVTLTVYKDGCDSTISHKVQITGTPGQLYLPNAFMPTSGTIELQKFIAKGSGIKKWHLQIFNNYGQLMWETSQLTDPKGTPKDDDGWDGTYRGAPVQQGVYIWQASATFINGTEWKGMSYNNSLPKRTGTINLIR